MSFHPVMLRLDRGILGIGDDDREITRSSRVMTGREKMSGNGRERKMSGNDDKKGKVESLSFHPVMLRLDRGILKIGDGEEITRSSRVMTGRRECQVTTIRTEI